MTKVVITDTNLTNIANAIRTKGGTSELIKPSEMATAITNLPSGGDNNIHADFTNLKNNTYLYNYIDSIDIDYNATSNLTSLNYFFGGLSNIKNLPLIDTSSATSTNGMFSSCSKIETIPLYNFSNSLITSSMFQSCSSLKTIPAIDTSKATNMYNMFYMCSSLQEITSLDTSSATSTAGMFQGCTSLSTIPQLDLSKATGCATMFSGCINLESVPALNMSLCTNANQMFYGCENLVSVGQLTTTNLQNATQMFCRCTVLRDLPEMNWSKVTSMQYAFRYMYGLSDESLNNILKTCISATSYTGTKTLYYLGVSSNYTSAKIQSLPSYQDFVNAGWSIGFN